MSDPRFPIGKFAPKPSLSNDDRKELIRQIKETPSLFRKAFHGLNDDQLDTPYREGGWSARQVAHHVPDSHMNAYIRTKLALTEEKPAIKPYDQSRWSELIDARTMPIEVSLSLLETVHARWVVVLESLTAGDFARRFFHPENGEQNLDWLLQMYAWHGRHHTAHVTELCKQKGW
ncbi:MAG: metal-dependent hydrolase [Ignavibacteria bacterium GWA2_55_11]|nr:MAG: metal-dependent hydrolase [Ignavibacteria bacterium GWA2_55_11]